jgi:hypothetical protein
VGLVSCSEDKETWQDVVDDFAEAICVNDCVVPSEQQSCVTDVKADMTDAKAALTDKNEANCIKCMKKKTELIPAVVANTCQSTAAQDMEVYAACDLDPNTDYDGDGTANNDDDEACAGRP